MTALQIKRAKALHAANLGLNARAKEFVRGMAFQADHSPDEKLSPAQDGYLKGLAWRHRRQIPRELAPVENPYDRNLWPAATESGEEEQKPTNGKPAEVPAENLLL